MRIARLPAALALLFANLLVIAQFPFPKQFSVNDINVENGLIFVGDTSDLAGNAAIATDFNNDGLSDLLIGAPDKISGSPGRGKIYVVFGKSDHSFELPYQLESFGSEDGIMITSTNPIENSLGWQLSSGDFNDDGIMDVLASSPNYNEFRGSVYVIYGSNTLSNPLDVSTLDGLNGYSFIDPEFQIFDGLGRSVNSTGDFNGDGEEDVIIGAPLSENHESTVFTDDGKVYVLFGNSSNTSAQLLSTELNGSNGFIINPPDADIRLGQDVEGIGDINNDGFDDILIGAPGSHSIPARFYVIFGTDTITNSTYDLSKIDGLNGFIIESSDPKYALYYSGYLGDVNNDGFDDIGVAGRADNYEIADGRAYIIYGKSEFAQSTLDPNSINGNDGFIVNGFRNNGLLKIGISERLDINNDGYAEIVLTARSDIDGISNVGEVYVIYGKPMFEAAIELKNLMQSQGFTIRGDVHDDRFGTSITVIEDFNNDGINDLAIGSKGVQFERLDSEDDPGALYVLFGSDNQLPAINPIPDQYLDVDSDLTLNLSEFFIDVDELGFSHNEINTNFLDSEISDNLFVARNIPEGEFTIEVIANDGSGFTVKDTFNIVTNRVITSIDDSDPYLNIYPSPFENGFSIEFNETFEGRITIFDLYGKVYLDKPVKTSYAEFEFKTLTRGIYIVRLQDAKRLLEYKVLKK
ncbi:MAG: FG-GAP-like repeat-containing protein [Cyclobacteriaceae bacterium]